jgi:ubiquinone/menaquinone biosynthesis C-methylase UbiE
MSFKSQVLRWLAGLMPLLLAGCAHQGHPADSVLATEVSVRPGINKPYFDEPKVEQWLSRFEIESREIWTERRRILECLGSVEGLTVADVGAGTGFLARGLAQLVGSRGQVFAVDILPTFLEHMRQQAAKEGLKNFTVVEGAEKSPQLPVASCDVVFTSDTYHHFEYPRSMNANIFAALKPGGTFVVLDFVRDEATSRKWILDHVRAGEAVVRGEVEAAGFEFVRAERFLKENYILFFRKPAR